VNAVQAVRRNSLSLAAVVALVMTGCDLHTPMTISAGAQQVHIVVTESEVRLTPTTVQAGDVYLVLDGPGQGFSFVTLGGGPFDDEAIARLEQGDLQNTAIEGFQVSCAPDGWSEERAWEGCGDVFKVSVVEGRYAILAPGERPGVRPIMAALNVVP
jgi:hypothetical protein